MVWSYSSGNFLQFNMSYFELIPSYQCNFPVSFNRSASPDNESASVNSSTELNDIINTVDNFTSCTPSDFCNTDIPYYIDYSNPESLYNWVQQLNLSCNLLQRIYDV